MAFANFFRNNRNFFCDIAINRHVVLAAGRINFTNYRMFAAKIIQIVWFKHTVRLRKIPIFNQIIVSHRNRQRNFNQFVFGLHIKLTSHISHTTVRTLYISFRFVTFSKWPTPPDWTFSLFQWQTYVYTHIQTHTNTPIHLYAKTFAILVRFECSFSTPVSFFRNFIIVLIYSFAIAVIIDEEAK